MSGNSGSCGRAGGFSRRPFADAYRPSRPLFDDEAGRDAELYELERLIAKYRAEARRFLDGAERAPDP